jgi:hypothetical protein
MIHKAVTKYCSLRSSSRIQREVTISQYFCEKAFRYHPNLMYARAHTHTHTHTLVVKFIVKLKNISYEYNEKILQL